MHLMVVADKRSGEFRTDVATAQDKQLAPYALQLLLQPPEVSQGAVVDDAVLESFQPARRTAGGEQQSAVTERAAVAQADVALLPVDRQSPYAQVQVNPQALGPAVDVFLRLVLPQAFAQRRPAVGRVGLGTDQADAAVLVELADAAGGCVGGHAAADQQVIVLRHNQASGPFI